MRSFIFACSALVVLVSTPAAAQDDDDDSGVEPAVSRGIAGEDGHREMPNWDGRGETPTAPGERALWIPRVLLAPLYFIAEYVVRRPIGALLTFLERHELTNLDLFNFGPGDRMKLIPTFSLQTGQRPTVGLAYSWQDAIFHGHNLRLSASYGGRSLITGGLGSAWRTAWGSINFNVSAVRRPDGVYSGLGSQNAEVNRARYSWNGYDARLSAFADLWRESSLGVEVGLRHREFGDNVRTGDSIPFVLDPARHPQATITGLPPGYEKGYDVFRARFDFDINTRRARPENTSGVSLRGQVAPAFSIRRNVDQLWVGYAANATAYWDVSAAHHVFSLSAEGAYVDDVRGELPFTEMPDAAGSGPLAGFIGGRVRGQSVAAVKLAYHWPIWQMMDGTIQAAVGNAFDGFFEEFSPGNLRMSYAIGFAVVGRHEHSLNLLFGIGTDTFENGPNVESIRLAIGARSDLIVGN